MAKLDSRCNLADSALRPSLCTPWGLAGARWVEESRRLCHGNALRQNRRLRQILAEATQQDASMGVYGQYVKVTDDETPGAMLRAVYLNVVDLSVGPAST